MTHPYQQALWSVSPEEAEAIWEALGQYVENTGVWLEEVADRPFDALGQDIDIERERKQHKQAEAVLDRMNAAGIALWCKEER